MWEMRREVLRRAVKYEKAAWRLNKRLVLECIKETRGE